MFTTPSATGSLPKRAVHHRQSSSRCTTLSDCSFHSAEEGLELQDLDECDRPDVLGWQDRKQSRLRTRSRSMESFPFGLQPSSGQGILECIATGIPAAEGTPLATNSSKDMPAVPPLRLGHTSSSKFKATISVEFSEEGPGGFKTSQNHLFVASQPLHFCRAGAPQRNMAPAASFQSGIDTKEGTDSFEPVSNGLFVPGQATQPKRVGSSKVLGPFQDGKYAQVRSPVKRTATRLARFACVCATPVDDQGAYPKDGIQGLQRDSVHEGKLKTPLSGSSPGRLRSIWASFRRRNSSSRSVNWVSDRGDECPEGESLAGYPRGAVQPTSQAKSTVGVNKGFADLQTKSLCPSIPGTDNKRFAAHGPNTSWVDEQFFDCNDTWEVMLAPFESAKDMNSSIDSQYARANNGTTVARDRGPQRPHRLKASVENFDPIYPALSARGGTDDVNRTWVGNLSAQKVRLPGLADVPRQDEMGQGVKTLEELIDRCTGIWQRIPEESDDPSPLCDVMELPWVFKRALGMATQTEVAVYEDRVFVKPKLFGIPIPTAATPWSREGVLVPRRDKRKGMSRISLVRTTFGFRQYNCWADPYAGMSIVEIGIGDDGKLVMSTFVKRRTGPSCKIRTCMAKMQ